MHWLVEVNMYTIHHCIICIQFVHFYVREKKHHYNKLFLNFTMVTSSPQIIN
jgi:hypothetical protein